jgi:methionyl-tRNA formyltransferase
MGEPGRVLYFGDPRGALALLDRGVTPAGVVHGRRGGPGWRRLLPRVADLPRWITPNLNDPAVVAELAALRPKLLVACFYPRRIPQPVLDLAPGLNVHPSDLPRWRGPDPVHWTLRAGDADTALCVQWLAAGLDEGDVLTRERVAIEPRESGGHLADRLEALGAVRVAEVAVRVLAGDALPATPQSGEVTWAPLADPDDLEIDWTRPAAEVDRLVRASAPDPGAFTGIGDELVVVFAGRPAEAGAFEVLPPGTPFVRGGEAFVRCGEGAYKLTRLQLGRRRLGGRDFARLLV